MLTADEALEKTKQSDFNKAMEIVESCSAKGELQGYCKDHLKADTIEKLTDLGFMVQKGYSFPTAIPITRISWGPCEPRADFDSRTFLETYRDMKTRGFSSCWFKWY